MEALSLKQHGGEKGLRSLTASMTLKCLRENGMTGGKTVHVSAMGCYKRQSLV